MLGLVTTFMRDEFRLLFLQFFLVFCYFPVKLVFLKLYPIEAGVNVIHGNFLRFIDLAFATSQIAHFKTKALEHCIFQEDAKLYAWCFARKFNRMEKCTIEPQEMTF